MLLDIMLVADEGIVDSFLTASNGATMHGDWRLTYMYTYLTTMASMTECRVNLHGKAHAYSK